MTTNTNGFEFNLNTEEAVIPAQIDSSNVPVKDNDLTTTPPTETSTPPPTSTTAPTPTETSVPNTTPPTETSTPSPEVSVPSDVIPKVDPVQPVKPIVNQVITPILVNQLKSDHSFTVKIDDKVENVKKIIDFDKWLCIQIKDEKPRIINKTNHLKLVGDKINVITQNYIKNYALYKLEDNSLTTFIRVIDENKITLVAFSKPYNFICNYKEFELPMENEKIINLSVVNKIDPTVYMTQKMTNDLVLKLTSYKMHKKEMVTYGDLNDMIFPKMSSVIELSYVSKLYSIVFDMAHIFNLV